MLGLYLTFRCFYKHYLTLTGKKEFLMSIATFTMRQLLEAGVHFGHHTRRWNPKWILIFLEKEITFIF